MIVGNNVLTKILRNYGNLNCAQCINFSYSTLCSTIILYMIPRGGFNSTNQVYTCYDSLCSLSPVALHAAL